MFPRKLLPLTAFMVFFLLFSGCKEDPELPIVSTSQVTDITTSSAEGGGNVHSDGGSHVTDRGVVWCTSSDPTNEINEGKTSDGEMEGKFTSRLTDLSSSTRYYVRAYATNKVGTAYGDEFEFTTEGEIPAVSTAEVTDITPVSALSGGEVVSEGDSEVTARGVVWSSSQTPYIDKNDGITSDGKGTGEFTSKLGDLSSSTSYYVRAYAINEEGEAYGDKVEFTTKYLVAADFNADNTMVKAGTTVNFNDESWGEVEKWEWDFGDGNKSSDQNPSNTYKNKGTYSVELTVYAGEDSDTKTKTDYIKVYEELSLDPFNTFDLSDGSLNFVVPSYSESDKLFVAIFPRDDAGSFHRAGSLLTSQEGGGQDYISAAGDKKVSPSEKDELHGMHCGTASGFIVGKQHQTLQNHREISRLSRSLDIRKDFDVGDEREFWVYDDDGFERKTAELKGKNENAMLWVTEDSEKYVSSGNVSYYLDQFEKYYSDLKDYFGREPDADDFPVLENADGRVNIVLSEMPYGGYFYSADLYSQQEYRHSNEDKVIYVRGAYSDPDFDYGRRHTAGVIAHEFQHLLHYNERILAGADQTETWINEGLSELAKDIAGFGFEQENPYQQSRVESYMEAVQDVSVTGWQQQTENYGASYVFTRYLYDQYKGDILEAIRISPDIAVEAIESYPATPPDFYNLFENYSLALLSASNQDIDLGEPYFFEIDIEGYSLFKVDLEPGEGWDNRYIRGWSMGFTQIAPGNGSDLLIEISDVSVAGRFRGVVLRY